MSTNQTSQKNSNVHITFIGGGNMGRALISGLITNGFKAGQITVVEANKVTAQQLQNDLQVQIISALENITFDFAKNNVLVMAIKPQDFNIAAKELAPKLKHDSAPSPLVLSIAAGIRLADMSRWLDQTRCVRAMPNTPALIGKGITGKNSGDIIDATKTIAHRDIIEMLEILEKKQLDFVRNMRNSACHAHSHYAITRS